MKKLLILLVLFTSSIYGQTEKFKSYSYSYARDAQIGWEEPIKSETTIEIDLEQDEIVLSNAKNSQVLYNISLKENFIDDNGYKGTTYSCQDKKGTKLEFIIMHETNIKNKKMIVLSYDKYLIAYDLYIQKKKNKMKNIKYTTDGKKVVVIGDLNQTDKIVQEIFVTENGDEIPQGERFVVKSLLDEPSKSWKEKNLESLEANYEKQKKYWDDLTNSISIEKRKAYDALSARVKWLKNIAKEPRNEEFKRIINTLADFFSDSEKWIVVRRYSDWDLVKFNEDGVESIIDRFEGYHERVRFDSMRLLSLYGKSDGNLEFRINNYSDGSGSDEPVVFFKSKEEALIFMQKEFDKIKEYSNNHLEISEKHGLNLDKEKLQTFKDKRKESIKKQIEETQTKLENHKKELSEL